MCQSDVSAGTTLLLKSDELFQVKNLADAQRVLKCFKITPHQGYAVRGIDIDQVLICAYSDASGGNTPGGRTQAGYFVLASDDAALRQMGFAAILDWRSH